MISRTYPTAAAILVFLMLACPAFATDYNPDDASRLAKTLGIDIDKGQVGELVKEFGNMSDAERDVWRYNTTVVLGSRMDATEKAAWYAAKSQYPELDNLRLVEDRPENYQFVKNAPGPVVFIGGPSQNDLMKKAQDDGLLTTDKENAGMFAVQQGRTGTGQKVLVFSDTKGYDNAARKAVTASPLAAIMPREAVPVAAAGISTVFMLIWNFIYPFIKAFFEKNVTKWRADTKGMKDDAFRILGIKVREVLSFGLAVAVLAAAIAYTFSGPDIWAFLPLFAMNLAICFLTQAAFDLTQYAVAALHGIKCEYVFWKSGAALTLFSAFLGNPFGLSGFTYTYKSEAKTKDEAKKRKRGEALAALIPSFIFMSAAFFFAVINFFVPFTPLQMLFTIMSFTAFLALIPISPLDGANIFRWNWLVWLAAFVPGLAAYVIINFIL